MLEILVSSGKKGDLIMNKIKGIGLIVEDNSDYNSLKILISRVLGISNLTFKKVIGNGCGKIKRKALAWSELLHTRGCNLLILVHDLDRNNLNDLKSELSKSIKESPIKNKLICIPIEEMESWLLSDPKNLKNTFSLKRIPKIGTQPESIASPKERLRDYIYQCSNKEVLYLNTKHNERIANTISLKLLRKRCPSFEELANFIEGQKY